jgi:FkbM family methyltransferase
VARLPAEYGGPNFWCDLSDDIARDVCLVGSYEPQVTRVLTRLLSPGMTVVDVGANWGYFTLLAASRVGPTGRVVAFEPDPRMFRLLERNLALNAFPHVEALPVAAGRSAEALTLEGYAADARNRGTSRVCDGEPADSTSFVVPSGRMDELLREQGCVIDLIKIDVEGTEDAVLDGMRDGLCAGRYRRVLVELHPQLLAARGLTPDRCCAALIAAGYTGWAFDHSPEAVRRAAYATSMTTSELLRRTDRVPSSDPWPHMLWTRPDAAPL